MFKLSFLFLLCAIAIIDGEIISDLVPQGRTSVSNAVWDQYKLTYGKRYATTAEENNARYYYAYNVNWINNENVYFNRGQRTYSLRANQFTDMRFIQFKALFPRTTQPATSNVSPAMPVNTVIPQTFNPITDLGIQVTADDQGTECNSGWAYATAKAVQLMQAMQTGVSTPFSAQFLIDCSSAGRGCTNQVPQTALDYLTLYGQTLHSQSTYPNRKADASPGPCIAPPAGTTGVKLASYSRIPDGSDTLMQRYVANGYPVIIEYDPTSFQFMHYSGGIFVQPSSYGGSHYMLVIGYGTDVLTSNNYWQVLNSFGTTWGENGIIRIRRDTTQTLAKNAYFPTALV